MSLFGKQTLSRPADKRGLRLPTNEGERFFYDMIGNELLRHRYIDLMASDDKTPAEIAKALNGWGYDWETYASSTSSERTRTN